LVKKTNVDASIEDIPAPMIPNNGIRIKLSITLKIAPDM
jgi:hypothetical protein